MPESPLTPWPLVSVVIPAYNAAKFIPEALESVFAQTYPHYEVILVNDGSPDTSLLETVISPYRKDLSYIVQGNAGPSAARNTGVRHARGDLIGFLDSDDILLPHFLEEHVSRAVEDRSSDVFYGDLELFGEAPRGQKTVMQLSPSSGDVNFQSLVLQRCNPNLCSVVRREALVAVGLFDESMHRSEDFDLWLRFAYAGRRFNYTQRVVARYRIRPGSLMADSVGMITGMLTVFDKCERTMTLNGEDRGALATARRRYRAQRHLELGKRALRNSDFATARAEIDAANAVLPTRKHKLVTYLLRVAPRLCMHLNRLRDRMSMAGNVRR